MIKGFPRPAIPADLTQGVPLAVTTFTNLRANLDRTFSSARNRIGSFGLLRRFCSESS